MSRFAYLFMLILFSACLQTFAQPYHNEWINDGQNYVKIKIANSGLYRIDYPTLISTGLPNIGSGFQLYRNGQQVPIYITTEGLLSSTDYVEFIGQPNEGSFDTQLFTNPDDQLSTTRSLFTDTATYFLTWNNTFPNLRFQNTANNLTSLPPAETYFWQTTRWTVNNQFNAGTPFAFQGNTPLRFSGFDPCEGFVGVNIASGATQTYNLLAPNLYEAAGTNAQVTVKVAGRSDDLLVTNDHAVSAAINATPYATATYDGFTCSQLNFEVPLPAFIGGGATLSITTTGSASAADVNAVAWYQLLYPRSYNFGGVSFFNFTLPDSNEKYLEISNFTSGTTPVLYDLSNNLRIVAVQEAGLLKFKLPTGNATAIPRNLYLVNTDLGAAISVNSTAPITFTNFNNPANQGNFLIITHPSLSAGSTDAVAAYANYRRSLQGGSYNVQVVSIDQLYNQFAYGIAKHPLSIRNFINYTIDNWSTPPQYVLLLGKGITYNQTTFNAAAFNACLVPTYGTPASDALLTARNNTNTSPQAAISRVPATTPAEVQNYLDKLIQYETSQNDFLCDKLNLWRKDIIHLAQGDTGEVDINTAYLANYQQLLESNYGFGGKVKGSFVNNKFGSLNYPEIAELLNNGVGLVQFTGNAGTNGYWLTDINPPQFYENEGRYPVMLASAGKSGSIYDYSASGTGNMMSDYTLSAQRGSAAFMGNSDAVIANASDTYTTTLLQNAITNNYGLPLAQNMKNTAATLLSGVPVSNSMLYAVQTTVLSGDPALSFVPRKKPEFALPTDELRFFNPLTGFPILSNPVYISSQMPQFEVKMVLKNLGQAISDSVDVTIQRILPSGDYLDISSLRLPATVYTDTLSLLIPNNLPEYSGFNSFVFTVDGSFEIDEDCEFNNTAIVLADMNPFCEVDLGPDELYLLPEAFPITFNAGNDWSTYQWSNGQTTPTIEISDFGTYTVTVTNSFGCVAVDAVVVSFNNSLTPVNNQIQINAWPNPTNSRLILSGVANCTLQIFNSSGSKVLEQYATSNSRQLSLEALPTGMYLLKAIHPQGVSTLKILKN